MSSKKTDLTVACVPTGINAGVSIDPLGVYIFPSLDVLSSFNNEKENFSEDIIAFYSSDKLIILSGFETSPLDPSPFLIWSTNSIPFITFPKTV